VYLLATAALVVWIIVWLVVAYRVIQRHDLGSGAKVLWILLILLFPIVGLLVYFLWDAARPRTT
jgi:Phospholipase_D-nuclease N-terminal